MAIAFRTVHLSDSFPLISSSLLHCSEEILPQTKLISYPTYVRWDDWVNEARLRKFTDENKELARNLKKDLDMQKRPAAPKPTMTSSKKKAAGSDLSSTRGSEERHSSVPAMGRGQKRVRDYEIDKVGNQTSLLPSSTTMDRPARKTKSTPMAKPTTVTKNNTRRSNSTPSTIDGAINVAAPHLSTISALSSPTFPNLKVKPEDGSRSIKASHPSPHLVPGESHKDINQELEASTSAIPGESHKDIDQELEASSSAISGESQTDIIPELTSSSPTISGESHLDGPEPRSSSPTIPAEKQPDVMSEVEIAPKPRRKRKGKAIKEAVEISPKPRRGRSSKAIKDEGETASESIETAEQILSVPAPSEVYSGRPRMMKPPSVQPASSGKRTEIIPHPKFKKSAGNEPRRQFFHAQEPTSKIIVAGYGLEQPLHPLHRPSGCPKPARSQFGSPTDGQESTDVNNPFQEESFHTRPAIRLLVPDHLKAILVDDWENVTKNLSLVPLPSKTPVNVILDTYFDEEKGKRRLGSADADLLEEVVVGVKEYFEKCLGRILLYRFEREQFFEIRQLWEAGTGEWEGKGAGDVYGAEHLCRLFGKCFLSQHNTPSPTIQPPQKPTINTSPHQSPCPSSLPKQTWTNKPSTASAKNSPS